MNWQNILENALGNMISDILIGVFIAFFIARFFEILKHRQDSIGALTLIEGEIAFNKHLLADTYSLGLESFEKSMKRGETDEIPVDQETFKDAAHFIKNHIDRLQYSAFNACYSGLGNINNKKLLEKILNIYNVSYYYRIQTALGMMQFNWQLVDEIKKRLKIEIKASEEALQDIVKEVAILEKSNIYLEALKFWKLME